MKSSFFLFVTLSLFMSMVSCGRPQAENPEDGAGRLPVSAFKVSVLPAGIDPAFPERQLTHTDAGEDYLAVGDEIVLGKTIQLGSRPDRKPLFLVWDEAAAQSRIHDAYFEFRKQDPLNRTTGAVDRYAASYDPVTRRWFIPLSRIFPSGESEIDAADELRVALDLHLSDGSHERFTLRFRARGALPAIVSGIEVAYINSPLGLFMADYVRAEGWVALRERYVNPSARELALWVHGGGTDPVLTLSSYVVNSHWIAAPHSAPVGPVLDSTRSLISLKVAGLRTRTAAGKQEYPLPSDRWLKIPLPPREALTLEWIARIPADVARCAVPAPIARTYRWRPDHGQHGCGHGDGGGCEPDEQSRQVVEESRLAGMRLEGRIGRKIILAERYVGAQDLEQESVRIAEGELTPVLQVGEQFIQAPVAGCQGTFVY